VNRPRHDGSRAWGGTARLEDVQAELGEIEALDCEVDDLTALLRGRLSPEQFRLVWALPDATERLAAAEQLLREGRLVNRPGRPCPCSCELAVDGEG
jgi:hypothetical protein